MKLYTGLQPSEASLQNPKYAFDVLKMDMIGIATKMKVFVACVKHEASVIHGQF